MDIQDVLPARAGMVRPAPRGVRGDGGAPRPRGDGPEQERVDPRRRMCSPPARGWSQVRTPGQRGALVLPARAGMVPARPVVTSRPNCAPRPRGDGPMVSVSRNPARTCSPPARGWSLRADLGDGVTRVLPARAGMVPAVERSQTRRVSAPRPRGDGPAMPGLINVMQACSPPARGWSPGVLDGAGEAVVLPARAGMVPGRGRRPCGRWCAPRPRGDGPTEGLRDDPVVECSSPARGWPPEGVSGLGLRLVLPARAGMAPWGRSGRGRRAGAPRPRGDGPDRTSPVRLSMRCSPPARGWLRRAQPTHRGRRVLPALAGMVPRGARPDRRASGAPRLRGDGPPTEIQAFAREVCSPPARGWSPGPGGPDHPAEVLPARAGMVPTSGFFGGGWPCDPRTCGDGPGSRTLAAAPAGAPRACGMDPSRSPGRTTGALSAPTPRPSIHLDPPQDQLSGTP